MEGLHGADALGPWCLLHCPTGLRFKPTTDSQRGPSSITRSTGASESRAPSWAARPQSCFGLQEAIPGQAPRVPLSVPPTYSTSVSFTAHYVNIPYLYVCFTKYFVFIS